MDNSKGFFNEEKIVLDHFCPVLNVTDFLQLGSSSICHAAPLTCSLPEGSGAVPQGLALTLKSIGVGVNVGYAFTELHINGCPEGVELLCEGLPGLISALEPVLSDECIFLDKP